MAVQYNSNVITDGLIFYYDIGNISKSWKGPPTTNQFAIPTPDSINNVAFQVQGTGTFQRIYSGFYGGQEIRPTDVVYRYDLGQPGCHYHGNDVAITSGTVATWSCDYYIDPGAADYPTINYLANLEGVVSNAAADPTPSIKGVWKRFEFSATASANGTCRMLLYPGGCSSSYLASSGFILYRNPQVEFNPPGGVASRFVAGTRTNIQALVDLIGQSTITTNSLQYTNDQLFQFAGGNLSSTISVPLSTAFNKLTGTISMWVNPTQYSGSNGLFVNRSTAEANAIDWFWIGSWDSGNVFYFRLGDGATCCNNDLTISNWPTVCPTNTWTNVTVSWTSGGTAKIYTNGVLRTSRSISSIPPTNPASTGTIGLGHESGGTGSWNGKIASTQIYNRQLTDQQVMYNFSALRGRFGI